MTARTGFQGALLADLAVLYAVTAYVALHPRASEHYRDYFIRRATTDWKVNRGTTSLADGFDLASSVYPQEVDYLRGLSPPESWGRWSNASMAPTAAILLREPGSGRLCLMVRLRATPLQAGAPVTIRLGDQSATVVPTDSEPRDYQIETQLTSPAWAIDLEPSRPAPGAGWNAHTGSPRRVAIGLIRLTLRPGPCPG